MAKKRTGPPRRRNTLTLDDDNAVRLERLRKERDLSFKDVVNNVIRHGLAEAEKPFRPQEPFRTKVFKGAKANFSTPEELKDLIEQIQLEEDLHKLGRR